MELRQGTAVTIITDPIVDADGAAATGLTISQADVRLSKNAGNMAQKNEVTSATHDELGKYTIPLDATDTDTMGELDVTVGEAGTLIWSRKYSVISKFEWDRKYTINSAQLSGVLGYGTGQSASAEGLVLAAGEAFADDTLIGAVASVKGATQAYPQNRVINDNALSGDTVTVDTWTQTPDGTPFYVLLAGAPMNAVTAARIAILADWANDGRLDLILDAIKEKTDPLTFGVAGKVDSNATHMNESLIAGTGQPGDLWRGA